MVLWFVNQLSEGTVCLSEGNISYVTINQRGKYTTREDGLLVSMCCIWLAIYLNNIYPDTERWKMENSIPLFLWLGCTQPASIGQSARQRPSTSHLLCCGGITADSDITPPKPPQNITEKSGEVVLGDGVRSHSHKSIWPHRRQRRLQQSRSIT